jgi:hypothetical protein
MARKNQPLTASQIERWHKRIWNSSYEHAAKLSDKRLALAPPLVVGMVRAVGKSPLPARQVVSIYRDALNRREELQSYQRRLVDRLRLMVMTDWVVRCALPYWVESMLPTWGNFGRGPRNTAEALRRMHSTSFPAATVAAFKTIHDLYCALEREQDDPRCDPRTGSPRHSQAHKVVRTAIDFLTESMTVIVSDRFLNADEYEGLGNLAAGLLQPNIGDAHTALVPSFVQMLDAVISLRWASSQADLEQLCQWAKPAAPKLHSDRVKGRAA